MKYVFLDHQQNVDGLFAAQRVESIGNIIDSTTHYEAAQQIVLEGGFEVDLTAEFTATIINPPTYQADWQYQFTISDHLGNLRMMYSDLNGNGMIDGKTEVTQETNYYPYGMRHSNYERSTLKNNYQYNGIEHVGDFGLDLNMATYRSLDASLATWGQIDIAAEKYYGLTPYNSMNNNPISNVDPDGDSPILIGAAIGVLSNGIGNAINGENFFKGAGQAALFGGIGGGISAGIGSAASGISNGFGRAAFQVGAHGLSGGAMSAAQGGNFWHGAAAGGFSSGVGSGIRALGGGAGAQWLGGGLSGGFGSAIAGGSFWDGARQGLITGGLNHAAHSLGNHFSKPDDIIILLNSEGAYGFGHTGMLIGNDQDGWTYISKDGRVDGTHLTGGNSRQTITKFKTLADFNSKAGFNAYDRAKTITTTGAQDKAAIAAATKAAKSRFHGTSSNCKHACQAGLRAAGLSTGSGIYPKNWFNSNFFPK